MTALGVTVLGMTERDIYLRRLLSTNGEINSFRRKARVPWDGKSRLQRTILEVGDSQFKQRQSIDMNQGRVFLNSSISSRTWEVLFAVRAT